MFFPLRFFIIGWTLQAVHVLDKKERNFRITIEMIPIICFLLLLLFSVISLPIFVLFVLILHTCFWLFDSTWLVGYREINTKFKGKGIQSVIDFTDWAVEELKNYDNISTITIYGSICRHMYHDRSDFDFRIVQTSGDLRTFFKMIQLRAVAIWKYKIPIDLKLVDSVDFLKNEMRDDEHPIVPLNREKCFYNEGDSYASFKANPVFFTKEYTLKQKKL